MNDLRQAAEMALEALESWQKTCLDCGRASDELGRATAPIQALRQALDDKPAVKTYCGFKPNYCTTEVDAVNMSQDRVDETAKGKHKVCYEIPDWKPGMVFPAPKREWVGLTDEDLSVCDEDGVLLARYWEAKLKQKNCG